MNEQPIVIHKFGGSCLRDASDIIKIAGVLELEHQTRNIIVVSALWGTTDRLIRAANEPRYAGRLVSDLHSQHKRFSPTIETSEFAEKYHKVLSGMEDSLSSLSQYPDDNIAYNRLLAAGERLSALVVANELRTFGFDSHPLGAEDIGVCLKTINNHTEVDIEKTKLSLQHEMLFGLPIVTGWFGKGPGDNIALLSRGGSDHTASALSVVLDAERVVLWKDVDGLYPLNPRWNISTRPLHYLGYGEALEFACRDAPILHTGSIEPLMRHGIPLEIRNVFSYAKTRFSTIIGPDIHSFNGIKGIACVQHVARITVHHEGMNMNNAITLVKEIQDGQMQLFGLDVHGSTVSFITSSSHLSKIQSLVDQYSFSMTSEEYSAFITLIGNGMNSFVIEDEEKIFQIAEYTFTTEHGLHFLTNSSQIQGVLMSLHQLIQDQVTN
jgi:aspartate kinase